MPRKRNASKISTSVKEACDITDSNIENSIMTSNTKSMDQLDVNLLHVELQEKYNQYVRSLQATMERELSDLDLAYKMLMLKMPKSLLDTTIDMNDEYLREIILYDCVENNQNHISAPNGLKRKRSKSATSVPIAEQKIRKIIVRQSRRRSSSLNVFKTPMSKVCLTALKSAKKYTVSKPAKSGDSAISLKRIMKPDEEAISVSGSPLIVQPSYSTAPTVNIPLPGGVVVNIEPRKVKGSVVIPELDDKTRKQLKILVENMSQML